LVESPGDADEFNELGVIGEYGNPGGLDSNCGQNIVEFDIPKMSDIDIASPSVGEGSPLLLKSCCSNHELIE
jgi:hypothetical protein